MIFHSIRCWSSVLVKKLVPTTFAANKNTFRKTFGGIQTMATKILKRPSKFSGVGKRPYGKIVLLQGNKNAKDDSQRSIALLTIPPSVNMHIVHKNDLEWSSDSACTQHMSNGRESFIKIQSYEGAVYVGNKENLRSYRTGMVRA